MVIHGQELQGEREVQQGRIRRQNGCLVDWLVGSGAHGQSARVSYALRVYVYVQPGRGGMSFHDRRNFAHADCGIPCTNAEPCMCAHAWHASTSAKAIDGSLRACRCDAASTNTPGTGQPVAICFGTNQRMTWPPCESAFSLPPDVYQADTFSL